GHTTAVNDIAISPDGRYVASVGRDGAVRLCDVATGKFESGVAVDGVLQSGAWLPGSNGPTVAGRGIFLFAIVSAISDHHPETHLSGPSTTDSGVGLGSGHP